MANKNTKVKLNLELDATTYVADCLFRFSGEEGKY
jgi:hypothetical protein